MSDMPLGQSELRTEKVQRLDLTFVNDVRAAFDIYLERGQTIEQGETNVVLGLGPDKYLTVHKANLLYYGLALVDQEIPEWQTQPPNPPVMKPLPKPNRPAVKPTVV